MATVTPTERLAPPDGDQLVEMRGIGWKGYKLMLRLRGEKSSPRMIYLDGDLLLVSPSQPHEEIEERFGHFVTEVVVGLRIPCKFTASTTFRRRKKDAGVEGDRTYYIANEASVRGKRKIDLRIDPPPDLAIEVVYSHAADSALEIHDRLGVPEVWVGDERNLQILARHATGGYVEVTSSLAFPFLEAAEILDWIKRPFGAPENEWIESVRIWVRDTLAPRVRERGEPHG